MKELATSAPQEKARKYSTSVLALLFAFAMEVLDGAIMAIGFPPEDRLEAALISVGLLLLVGLAIYGLHHRTKWGTWLAVGIGCVTIGFSLPTLVFGNLIINDVAVDQTPLSQAVGWTKVAAYALFLFLLGRERLTGPSRQS